ncbi:MAG: ABC transporter substrate-binding protein [Deltaproteobacteria bacterium]|nr:ABC transporter substrate-binding protein [Deltaproteobacteria bacterium]
MRWVTLLGLILTLGTTASVRAQESILIGLDADMSSGAAISGEAIRRGAMLAIEEINQSGGVLGKTLKLEPFDHRGNPARGRDNIEILGARKEVVAIIGGIHTPVAMNEIQSIHKHGVIYLGAWAAGTAIVDNGNTPNYVFRVSVRDEYAGSFLVKEALGSGYKRIGMLLERTGWGRSNESAIKSAAEKNRMEVTGVQWIHWGTTSVSNELDALLKKGADVIMLVANSQEGAVAVEEMARVPAEKRRPILSHWGIMGGEFFNIIGWGTLSKVDLRILQTITFYPPHNNKVLSHLLDRYLRKYSDTPDFSRIAAPDGVAHAYDLVHLLALAIKKAGTTDRRHVRDALENLPEFEGVMRRYAPAFTPTRHDALSMEDYILARFTSTGSIQPFPK